MTTVTAPLSTADVESLLQCLDAYYLQAAVPAYDPDFPGLNNEPLSVVCPSRPHVPDFFTTDEPTSTLCLCPLDPRMDEHRLVSHLRYYLRRTCRLRYLRVFGNSDGRSAWALVTFDSRRDAEDAHRVLHHQPWDGQLLRTHYCRFVR